jgi:hypothetical protein
MRGMGEGVRGFKEGMHGGNQSQSQTVVPPTPAAPPALPTEKPDEEKKV